MEYHKPYEDMTDEELDEAAEEFEKTHAIHVVE